MLDLDDPAFALVTINEIVLTRAIAIAEAKFEVIEHRLARIANKQLETAKAVGEAIITAGAAYVASTPAAADITVPALMRAEASALAAAVDITAADIRLTRVSADLHLNGYKIANPAVPLRTSHEKRSMSAGALSARPIDFFPRKEDVSKHESTA